LDKNSNEYKGKYKPLKNRFDNLSKSEARLIELQDTPDRPYFLWHLWFKDVFDEKGFDILIGNPPYIQLHKLGVETSEYEKAGFQTFARTGDIYCLFYELGNELLRPGGILCYITSNSWLKTQYGEALRKYLAENTNPLKLLNFEDTKIFHTATVETNILLLTKGVFNETLEAVAIHEDYTSNTPIENYFLLNSIKITEFDNDGWVILSKEDYEIKKHIEKVAKPLKDFNLRINFGVKTGFNAAFLIQSGTKENLFSQDHKNSEIIKPVLRGRDVEKYSINFDEQWIIATFPSLKLDIDNYPSVRDYLLTFGIERLEQTGKEYLIDGKKIKSRKKTGNKWFETQDQISYWRDLEKEKILWGELSDKPKSVYDNGKFYAEATLFMMTGEKLKYLLAILNSNIASWYFNTISTTSGMGTNRWKKYKIEKLPIPDIEDIAPFEILAEYLTILHDKTRLSVNPFVDNRSIATIFEDALNMMVYELYFEDHMKENEIDVLRFLDSNIFRDISQVETDERKAKIIGEAYSWLQQSGNPIRDRITLANIRSKDIIRKINSSTH
jgi:hypothetical protein